MATKKAAPKGEHMMAGGMKMKDADMMKMMGKGGMAMPKGMPPKKMPMKGYGPAMAKGKKGK